MYKILLKKRAKKFIDKLPMNEKRRVVAAIERLRVGEYRIIYTVDNGELVVYVIDAGNRGQIYNRY